MTNPRRINHLRSVPPPTPPAPRVPIDDPVVVADRVGVRYGRRSALADCSLTIPTGAVVAVVGRNGAGKSTLLRVLAGLQRPSSGSLRLLGRPAWPVTADQAALVGFIGQDRPLYRGLRVHEMLTLGRRLNRRWDQQGALERLKARSVPLDQKVSRLSGGQRTQVALAMALAKQPSLLVLDEPLGDLDPIARRDVMGSLMLELAERNCTVVLSSHSLTDLTRACDWLVLLDGSRVRLAGAIDQLLAEHEIVVGPTEFADDLARRHTVVSDRRERRQAIMVIAGDDPATRLDPRWTHTRPTVQELVFAYLGSAPGAT